MSRLKGVKNMWCINRKRYKRSEDSKIEIDKTRVKNGLKPLFK